MRRPRPTLAPPGRSKSPRPSTPAGKDATPLGVRLIVLGAVAAIHCALLLLWLAPAGRLPAIQSRQIGPGEFTLALYRASPVIAAAPSSPPPPPATPPPPPPEQFDTGDAPPDPARDIEPLATDPSKQPDPAEPVSMAVSLASLMPPGGKCDLAGNLQAYLQADEKVATALATIPRPARSVANAIMVWDGAWVPVAAGSVEADVTSLRMAILEGVLAAPPDCRDEINQGPVLVALAGAGGTTILALGSGAWRASDLLFSP